MNNVEYPNHDEITAMIKNYIDSSMYKYAVLIDGEWGCGKTHFVENVLIEKLKEHIKSSSKYKHIIYTSLYGVSSIQDASSKLYLSLISGGDRKIVKQITPLISGILKGANVNISVNDIGSSLSTFVNISNYIIFVDDLERCSCNISEIMGLLNNFVEHSETKIIIIANEKEIENIPGSLDALQCLAAVNEKIMVPSKKKDDTTFTSNELRQITEELFDGKSNYEKIKEKLIGQTIKYKPDLRCVIETIVEKNIKDDESLQRLLQNKKDYFVKEMERLSIHNFRTFQFFLDKIIRISRITKQSCPQKYDEIMPMLIEYAFYSSLCYKQGKSVRRWEANALYSSVNITDNPYSFDHIMGFAFIDYAVEYNVFDEEFIKTSIESYFEYVEEQKRNSAYQQDGSVEVLSSWWEYSDNEVLEAIEDICTKVINRTYSTQYYPNIIKLLVYPIVECEFNETSFEKTFEFMIDQIKRNEVKYSWRDYHSFFEAKPIAQKCNELMGIVKQAIEEKDNNETDKKLEEILASQTWGQSLYDDMREREKLSRTEQSIVSKLDVDKIIDLIKTSSNKQINMFRYYISALYDFSNIYEFYKDDIPNIEKLIAGIQAMPTSSFGKIKKKQIELLLKLLEDKLSDLQK